MADLKRVEYRVRKAERFIVTRYHEGHDTGGVDTKGDYDNEDVAHEVAYALCKAEHERLGWPLDDDRIQYPRKNVEVVRAKAGDWTESVVRASREQSDRSRGTIQASRENGEGK